MATSKQSKKHKTGNQNRIVEVPLDELEVSEHNVRKAPNYTMSFERLKGSIDRKGLLQLMVVCQDEDGAYKVAGGGRRLRALRELAESGDSWVQPNESMICWLAETEDEAEIIEISLTENLQRLQLNDVDAYEAFQKLRQLPGGSVSAIARSFGIPKKKVEDYLSIGKIHPDIRECMREGRMNAENFYLFAKCGDLEKQLSVFERYGPDADLRILKTELQGDIMRGDHPVAKFIGEEYEQRGGTFNETLFSSLGTEEGRGKDSSAKHGDPGESPEALRELANPGLAAKLAEEKLSREASRIAKEVRDETGEIPEILIHDNPHALAAAEIASPERDEEDGEGPERILVGIGPDGGFEALRNRKATAAGRDYGTQLKGSPTGKAKGGKSPAQERLSEATGGTESDFPAMGGAETPTGAQNGAEDAEEVLETRSAGPGGDTRPWPKPLMERLQEVRGALLTEAWNAGKSVSAHRRMRTALVLTCASLVSAIVEQARSMGSRNPVENPLGLRIDELRPEDAAAVCGSLLSEPSNAISESSTAAEITSAVGDLDDEELAKLGTRVCTLLLHPGTMHQSRSGLGGENLAVAVSDILGVDLAKEAARPERSVAVKDNDPKEFVTNPIWRTAKRSQPHPIGKWDGYFTHLPQRSIARLASTLMKEEQDGDLLGRIALQMPKQGEAAAFMEEIFSKPKASVSEAKALSAQICERWNLKAESLLREAIMATGKWVPPGVAPEPGDDSGEQEPY